MQKATSIVLLAMLAIGSIGFIPSLATADGEAQILSVRMRGIVTQWGSTEVFGWITANAKITNINGTHREWARVHAIWSTEAPRLNHTGPPTESFTFSLYAARLLDASMIKFDYSESDFFISGQWTVEKITIAVNVNESGELVNATRTIEPVVTNQTGELRVINNWHLFQLDITGIDLLRGGVLGYSIVYREIKIFDLDDDEKVKLQDLVKVAKRYGSMPGVRNYDVDMDFNFDCKIDIADLTSLAANIEG